MSIYQSIFGKRQKPVVRGIRSPFMNHAHRQTPVAVFGGGTAPAPLANIADEVHDSHFDTPGVTTITAAANTIIIDLGIEKEVYEINVKNLIAGGIKSNNAANAGTVGLYTNDGAATGYVLRGGLQTPAGTAFEVMDIDYVGEGIPVRYVKVELTPDGTYTLTIDLSEIMVFGA